jgi:hypothetical protein
VPPGVSLFPWCRMGPPVPGTWYGTWYSIQIAHQKSPVKIKKEPVRRLQNAKLALKRWLNHGETTVRYSYHGAYARRLRLQLYLCYLHVVATPLYLPVSNRGGSGVPPGTWHHVTWYQTINLNTSNHTQINQTVVGLATKVAI